MNPDLLEILCCPKTKESLQMAESSLIERLNEAIRAGSARTIGGDTLDTPIEEALFEPKNAVIYSIRDGIPQLIYESGIFLKDIP